MAREKHLNAATRNEESRKRRKLRNILLLILIFLMVAAVVAEALLLKNMTSVDRRFIREVERGVIEGWSGGHGDLQLKEKGIITDPSFIYAELEAVSEFANKTYQDKSLKKLAKRYITDLRECKSAAAAHDPVTDSDAFWKEFGSSYTDRLIILRTLYTGDFKMGNGWDKYPDQRDEVLLKGWLAKTASSLRFEKTTDEKEENRYIAVLNNDSGFDIEYLIIDIKLYNKKGQFIGVAEVYKENIKNGSHEELLFFYKGKEIGSYTVIGADCGT